MTDVAIVGGGASGLAVAAALLCTFLRTREQAVADGPTPSTTAFASEKESASRNDPTD